MTNLPARIKKQHRKKFTGCQQLTYTLTEEHHSGAKPWAREKKQPQKVEGGPICDVYLVGEASEAYDAVLNERSQNRVRQKKQIQRRFRDICQLGHKKLPDTHFKHEGSFSSGAKDGKKYAVFAVKAFQLRIYGILIDLKGRPVFLGLRADLDKKKDKADKNKLEATARDAVDYDNGK